MPLNPTKLAPAPLSSGRNLPGALAFPAGLNAGGNAPQAPTIPASPPFGTYGRSVGGAGSSGIGYGQDYANKLRNIFGTAAIVGYWVQDEPAGTASLDSGAKNHPGVYTAVTLAAAGIGDGRTAASYDGATSKNVIYSAGLNTDFNNQECTILLWAKVSGAGVWTDATVRNGIQIAADANNYFQIARTATNNQLNIAYNAGSTVKAVTDSSLAGTLAYFSVGMTVSKAGDALKAYINGAQVGATQTALGVWAGALGATLANIGCAASTPTAVWSGTLAHVLVLNVAATAAQMAIAQAVP